MMKNEMIWLDRKFEFTISSKLYPMVVERLRGGPARLEEKVSSLSNEIVTRRDGETWTIAQNVGHLMAVEELWEARYHDFMEGRETLRAADIKKSRAQAVNFSGTPIETLLAQFRAARESLVARLYNLTEEQAQLTAHHPRLDKPMRLIDSCFFAAEHDDHHLARITDLIQMWG